VRIRVKIVFKKIKNIKEVVHHQLWHYEGEKCRVPAAKNVNSAGFCPILHYFYVTAAPTLAPVAEN
jgi:hypothetical protein